MPDRTTSTHDPLLFAGAAEYYACHRAPYPTELFDYLVDGFELDSESLVIDVGAGTGQLAIPLARRGTAVAALEPDLDMVRVAVREADGLPIAWLPIAADWLGRPPVTRLLPRPKLVIFGASFHWTDRSAVARAVADLVTPDGALVLASNGESAWAEDRSATPWTEVARSTVVEFLGEERRAGSSTYQHPRQRHEDVLRASPLSDLELRSFQWQRVLTTAEVIGLQLSMSYASPRLLGDRLDAFCACLDHRLRDLEPSGKFRMDGRCDVIVARRPETA